MSFEIFRDKCIAEMALRTGIKCDNNRRICYRCEKYSIMPVIYSRFFGYIRRKSRVMEEINWIDFDSLKNHLETNTFTDKLAMFWDWKRIADGDMLKRINISALVICERGRARLTIDLREYVFEEGNILFLNSGQIMKVDDYSEDFHPLCLVVTDSLLNDALYKVDGLSEFVLEIRSNNLIKLTPSQYHSLKESYNNLSSTLKMESPFKMQIIEHRLISIFYECYGYIKAAFPVKESVKGRREELFNRFLNLLKSNSSKEHNPAFYAEELSVTSKYLSEVCKKVSGKPIKKWIDEYLTIEAQVLLKSTDKTIQQIAWQLNFDDAALFGKFFKRIVGISPKEYRFTGADNGQRPD